MWIGHLGLGWLGTKNVPVSNTATLATPVVGVRYWATPMIGIDAGLGFYSTSGSTTAANGTTQDDSSRSAFVLHGGVPLALAGSGHFSLQITPELDIGFGSGTDHPATGNIDLSGMLLQFGARAGGELYFGFIGIPQLALEASAGLFLQSTSGKSTAGGNTTKHSSLVIATSNVNSPWDIFRSDVAARYYF